jgi:hypothetical protein
MRLKAVTRRSTPTKTEEVLDMKLMLSADVPRGRRRSCPGWMLLPANHLGTAGGVAPLLLYPAARR